jgi:hypothetical protein
MKQIKYITLLFILAFMSSTGVFAKDSNRHSVEIPDSVQVGGTLLKPGKYDVKWKGAGPGIQVSFVHDGKIVATVPGTLKTNDPNVTADDLVIDTTSTTAKTLKEIDFSHNKESLIFEQSGM